MKKLRSTLFLLFAFFLVQNTTAQEKQVFFNVSALSQPDEFHFPVEWFDNHLDKQPAIELNLGYTSSLGSTGVFWETSVSYQYIQSSYTIENDPPTNDPGIPDKATFKYRSNILGQKAGIGYKLGSGKERYNLTIVVGASGYIPLFSRTKTKYDDGDWQKQPLYTNSDFKYGILYGFYLKPTYQLKLRPDSPWALNIFGEANLLWRNEVDYGNPLFMAGGGLGVSYLLK